MKKSTAKKDLLDVIALEAGITHKVADKALAAVFGAIIIGVTAGERVVIKDFGTFELKETAERQGRNPKTGEQITIAAKNTVRFKFSKAAEGGING